MKKIIAVLVCVAVCANGCGFRPGKVRTEFRKEREFEEVKRSLLTTMEKGLKYKVESDQAAVRGYSVNVPISKCEVEIESYLDQVTPMVKISSTELIEVLLI